MLLSCLWNWSPGNRYSKPWTDEKKCGPNEEADGNGRSVFQALFTSFLGFPGGASGKRTRLQM